MNEPHLASAEFGGFWIRFLAVVVDSAIVFLLMALIVAGGAAALGDEMLPVAGLAAWLFGFFYWPVMQASKLQATFGKALLRLRVTGYQGNRISLLRSLGRELSKLLSSAVFMLGYIIAGLTARKQALHDLVASTYVVREGKPRIVPALAVMVAGFVLPVVVVPLLVGGAMMDSVMSAMTAMGGMEQSPPPPPPMKPGPPVVAAAPTPPSVPTPPSAPAPAAPAEPKAVPDSPAPVIQTKTVEAPQQQPVAAVTTPAPAPPAIETKRPEPPKPEPKKVVAPKAAPKPIVVARPAQRPASTAVAKAQARPAPVPEPRAAPAPKYNDLMTAVLYKDAEAVSELLRHGSWVDKPDSRGATPLMVAAELGDTRTAEALLKGGANPARATTVALSRGDGAMLDLLKRYGAR